MQSTRDNINYKFIPSCVTSFDNITRKHTILVNDIYEKYEATAEVSGELIICNDANQMKNYGRTIVKETFESYLIRLENRNPKKDIWIYNIINGVTEQDSILYRDKLCIVIPTYTWDSNDTSKLHILCLPTDTRLRTIRSLTSEHIPLLEHMKRETIQTIKNKYDLDESNLKMFFHYEPSTYHLHIHFVNIANDKVRSSVEYSHELNSVLFNLSICSDYYRIAMLNTSKEVNEDDKYEDENEDECECEVEVECEDECEDDK